MPRPTTAGVALARAALLSLVLLGGALAGCSDPPNVSATCPAPAKGCDEGLTCETAVPGGYCTKLCATQGSRAECPEGSICDDVSGAGVLECARICSVQSDCRADLGCNGTTGASVKICKVKV